MAINPDYNTPPARRTGSSLAAWAVGILVVIGVIWAIAALWDRGTDPMTAGTTDAPNVTAPGGVVVEEGAETQPTTGAADADNVGTAPGEVIPGAPAGARVINDNFDPDNVPQEWLGQTAVAMGDVDTVYSQSLFTVDFQRGLGTNDLFVFASAPQTTVADDARLRVVGELRLMSHAELEQLAGIPVDRDAFGDGTRPVLVASEVAEVRED